MKIIAYFALVVAIIAIARLIAILPTISAYELSEELKNELK